MSEHTDKHEDAVVTGRRDVRGGPCFFSIWYASRILTSSGNQTVQLNRISTTLHLTLSVVQDPRYCRAWGRESQREGTRPRTTPHDHGGLFPPEAPRGPQHRLLLGFQEPTSETAPQAGLGESHGTRTDRGRCGVTTEHICVGPQLLAENFLRAGAPGPQDFMLTTQRALSSQGQGADHSRTTSPVIGGFELSGLFQSDPGVGVGGWRMSSVTRL